MRRSTHLPREHTTIMTLLDEASSETTQRSTTAHLCVQPSSAMQQMLMGGPFCIVASYRWLSRSVQLLRAGEHETSSTYQSPAANLFQRADDCKTRGVETVPTVSSPQPCADSPVDLHAREARAGRLKYPSQAKIPVLVGSLYCRNKIASSKR